MNLNFSFSDTLIYTTLLLYFLFDLILDDQNILLRGFPVLDLPRRSLLLLQIKVISYHIIMISSFVLYLLSILSLKTTFAFLISISYASLGLLDHENIFEIISMDHIWNEQYSWLWLDFLVSLLIRNWEKNVSFLIIYYQTQHTSLLQPLRKNGISCWSMAWLLVKGKYHLKSYMLSLENGWNELWFEQ